MKMARTENKGVNQTLHSVPLSRSEKPQRPNFGNIEKPGRSTPVSSGLDSPVGPHIPRPEHEQIAERARAIWEQKGFIPGQDQVNWCEAEAQLRAAL